MNARPSRGSRNSESAHKRRIVLLWTIVLTAIIGVIELPLPVEDAYRAARAELRAKTPSQNIVLVEVDDRTLRELQSKEPSRADTAVFIEHLFDAGAEKIVFDRAFADPSYLGDDWQMARTLQKYGERVRLGASPPADNGLKQHEGLVPNKILLPFAHLASMMGESGPFDLSVKFRTDDVIEGKVTPSVSAFLAGYKGRSGAYRPDFAYDVDQVPTLDFVDILKGRVAETDLKGKAFIVAETHLASSDFHNLPLGERVPGAYFHVIGANTLAEGLPVDLGWLPAACLVLVIIALQSARKRPSLRVFWAALAPLAFVPLATDFFMVGIDVMPAILGLMIGFGLLGRLARTQYADENNCLRVSTLAAEDGAEAKDVFALRICNLAALNSALAHQTAEQIISTVTDRIEAGGEKSSFAFENNTIVWLKPCNTESYNHALGLHALFRSGMRFGELTIHVAVTIGLDSNLELPLKERIRNAIQCAEDSAKNKSPVRVADRVYLSERSQRIDLLTELDNAMENREIEIAYQPQVMISGGRIYGAEALLRWHHPRLGEVSPQEIVELAEENGRIARLTDYVLAMAIEESHAAIELDPRFTLAVNISALSLADELFLGSVARHLQRHGFAAKNLILEVTETSPLDSGRAAKTLQGLRAMDINLSIDDFGTGHSNLDYLQRVPSSEIKIDRLFVTGMDQSSEKAAVVRATIAMAHALDRSVIAEGVETREVAEALQLMGCTRAQGFLYSRAIPMRQLLGLLHRGRLVA